MFTGCEMEQYLSFVAAALAVNTISSFLSIDPFKKRWLIENRDIGGKAIEIVKWFECFILPLLKRLALFEIVLCILLIAFGGKTPPDFFTKSTCFILFLPQLIVLFFMCVVELWVFIVLDTRSSFRNNRPYWISLFEFVFILSFFGLLDILFPSLFDWLGKKAFENAKPEGEFSQKSMNNDKLQNDFV